MSDTPCKADIRQWSMAELQAYQSARVSEWLASGRFGDDMDAIVAKCNEELEVYDEHGAWGAECACGWKGNNPYPSKEDALSSLQYHYDRTVAEVNGG